MAAFQIKKTTAGSNSGVNAPFLYADSSAIFFASAHVPAVVKKFIAHSCVGFHRQRLRASEFSEPTRIELTNA
jgi:hypothetical protein